MASLKYFGNLLSGQLMLPLMNDGYSLCNLTYC